MASKLARSRSLAGGVLLLALTGSLGPTCKQFNSISYFEPTEGILQVTAQPVFVWGRIGKSFDPASAAFEVDGIDLVAALGLVPPFENAGGAVMVGPDVVTVSGFSFVPFINSPAQFTVFLDGLPAGAHTFTTSAEKAGVPVVRERNFSLVDAFGQELVTLGSAGQTGGPIALGTNVLANASLGQAIAAPPIALPSGGSLRSGHVEAAEQRIATGGP